MSSSSSLQTKQIAEFKSLVNETRRLLGLSSEEESQQTGDRNEFEEEEHKNDPSSDTTNTSVVTWGEMRADPIISAFFAERLVSVVVAARINKVVDILTPPPSASSTGPTNEKDTGGVGGEGTEDAHEHKNNNETKLSLSLLKKQKRLEQRQVAPKDMRLTTDGTTDNFGIKLLVKSTAEIEGKLSKTAGANAIANQTKREEDRVTREANRVQRHLQRLKEQQQQQVKPNPLQGGTDTAPFSVVNEGENEEVEEVEEVEEEDPEESDNNNDGNEGNEDAPPPPPPDNIGEDVGVDESPPPPPEDDDDSPPPPPPDDEPEEGEGQGEGEEEDVPPPPPEDDDLPPPPPPDEE